MKTFTASTLRPLIAQVLVGKYNLETILSQHGISCLQLEIDIAAALRPLFQDEEGKVVGKQGDVFDFIKEQAKHDSPLAYKMDMRERIQKTLRKNISDENYERGEWAGFDRWLVAREKDGETIEKFMEWWNIDDFRAKQGAVYLNSNKIKENWLQEFYEASTEQAKPEQSGGYR